MFKKDFIVGIAVSSDSLLFAIAVLSGFLILAILISMMRIYKKAGKPSISAIIPIWSQISMVQITEKPLWYVIFTFIPILNILVYIPLAKKFGKGTGFAIGMLFLPMIFIPLLSFYDYVSSNEETNEEPIYNPFNETNVEQVMPSAPIEPAINTIENIQPAEPELAPVVSTTNENIDQQSDLTTLGTISEIMPEPVAPMEQNIINEYSESPITNEADEIEKTVIIENIPKETQSLVENEVNANLIEPVEIKGINNEISNEENAPIIGIENLENALNSTNIPETFSNVNDNMLDPNKEIEPLYSAEEESNEEVIEMPEIAARVCPACGVSLSADNKFCTACGTQI